MSFWNIFRKKSVEAMHSHSSSGGKLERTLGAFQLVLLGIGAIVGAGIFVIIGPASGAHAGPAIVLSLLLAGLACACAGLCYAELAASIPISGGAYSYMYATLGEIVAWLIAGMMFLTYFMGAATVASGWSSYLLNFLGDFNIYIPAVLSDTSGTIVTLADGSTVKTLFDLPAFLLVALITMVLTIGTGASAVVNTIIVFIKMVVLAGFVIVGVWFIDPTNWVPFIPENTTGTFGEFGITGIVSGASLVLFAFTGFDVVATAAQEAKDPQRSLPIGILGSLFVATLTYICIALVLTGVVDYPELNHSQPMATAVDYMGLPWFKYVIKFGAVAGLPSVVLALTYGMTRVLFTMSRDGLLPGFLSVLHKRLHTPHILTMIVGGCIAIMSATIPLENLAKISNFGTASTFAMVCFAALFMRYKAPNMKRDFLCPFMPVVPIIGIILFAQILLGLSTVTYIFAAVWIALLLLIYATYSYKRSTINN